MEPVVCVLSCCQKSICDDCCGPDTDRGTGTAIWHGDRHRSHRSFEEEAVVSRSPSQRIKQAIRSQNGSPASGERPAAARLQKDVAASKDHLEDPVAGHGEIDEVEESVTGSRVAIDDPVRMYLMQMGQIPLLSRAEEISAAKDIDRARFLYRHSMLATDYVLEGAVDALEKVRDGAVVFR